MSQNKFLSHNILCNVISILGRELATQINYTETLRKSEIATPST